MHILLIRFSSMGDVVLQTATINWLKSLYGKKLRLSFATSEEFSSLLDKHPFVDELICLDRRQDGGWKSFYQQINKIHKENPFDLILDLHGTMRSYRLRWMFWRTPSLSVDKRRWERWLLTKLKGTFFKNLISPKVFGLENQVHRLINDIQDVFGDSRGIEHTKEFIHSKVGELTSLTLPPPYGKLSNYIVVAPSASFQPKRWPVDRFVELTHKLLSRGEKVIVLAGPSDHFCDAFNSIKSENFLNLQGKTSLSESMSIISSAKLCIGNDSGMNHIAEAYGVKCLTIFGPTDPRFGFAPHADNSRFISKSLWCKPCSTTGSKNCFRKSLFCMESISVDEVYNLSLEQLT
ncbi:MAG: glycosyltransferase family 9 protein [Bacteriovoracaceae bacterium]